jgi:peptidoglycan/xylan/chitin deacetylase (PgdA/CDA1 family)
MEYLAKECVVVKPCEIYTMVAEGQKTVVSVTFDDAFVSVLENAVPVLKEYGIPAGIFVPTGRIGQRPDWAMASDCPDKNETLMDEQQIVALDKDGFEILSHTVTHSRLTDLNEADLEKELKESKQHLEHMLGHDVPAISYPHGACNAGVLDTTQKAGYTLGFTVDPNTVDNAADALRIGRFSVSPGDGLRAFKLKANGACQVVNYLRKLKRMLVRRKC